MELSDINVTTNKMLKKLVSCLGFDDEYYENVTRCPIIFADFDGVGAFLTAKSEDLKEFLTKTKINIDKKKKEYIFNEGLIIVNKKYKNMDFDADLFVTLVHEKLHSSRMLLINSQYSENPGVNSIFYDNDHFVQSTVSKQPYYADAGQEIFMGSFDDSEKEVNKRLSLSDKKRKDISFADEKYGGKMLLQYKVDEALVEIMGIVAYKLYVDKTNDIMKIVREINERYSGVDIKAITSIILRHNDLELFKWMIDPLSYQVDDINYDYFSHYITDADKDDINKIIGSDDLSLDDVINDDIVSSRIKKH